MKNFILPFLLLIATQLCFAQTDTLFTIQGNIPCLVKEITPEAIKYSLPGENVVNTVYRTTVEKIVFQNGRVQTFNEATALNKIKDVREFNNVTVTQVEGEVRGLFKLGEINSSAQGSNIGKVQDRAERKMKMMAAMMGGNIVYLADQQAIRGGFASTYQGSTFTATQSFLTGVVYTNNVLSVDDFKTKLAGKTEFRVVESASLSSTGTDIQFYPSKRKFTLRDVKNENGVLVLDGALEGASRFSKLQIAAYDEAFFYIFYEEKGYAYNVKIKL